MSLRDGVDHLLRTGGDDDLPASTALRNPSESIPLALSARRICPLSPLPSPSSAPPLSSSPNSTSSISSHSNPPVPVIPLPFTFPASCPAAVVAGFLTTHSAHGPPTICFSTPGKDMPPVPGIPPPVGIDDALLPALLLASEAPPPPPRSADAGRMEAAPLPARPREGGCTGSVSSTKVYIDAVCRCARE